LVTLHRGGNVGFWAEKAGTLGASAGEDFGSVPVIGVVWFVGVLVQFWVFEVADCDHKM
jgi:hypothetical protein